MNIPLSAIEPFGYTGMPFAKGRYLMHRHAQRLLEICEGKARYWISNVVRDRRGWTDQQLRKYLMAELLHETDWLAVTVHFSHKGLYIYLDHIEYSLTRRFFVSR